MDKFAALSDPNRRRIIEMISAQGELTAGEISEKFTVSAPAISQHLKVLREAEILNMEKRAQQRIYSINPAGVDEMWEWLGKMRSFWNTRFDALEQFLKDGGK
ncbi:metalloregulator ArsR/SmtB family transcription factor [uncultured Sneathiella sp.]|uniref:ArsR/SmtB family transcription factor n=1 Tax=uncultured Sneathiella sp. TaxID=879315 RepID=UPI0030EC3570|tara:strand:+ start:31639 stop:31947 length:309 start_codon:yes stop_codon:yes gene_type:complete